MKQSLKTLSTVLIVIIAYFAISGLVGGFSVKFDAGDERLTFKAPKDYTITLAYDRIKSIELAELPDTEDNVLSGGENNKYAWGERENDTLGTYTLCVSKKINAAIMFTTTEGDILFFNYESKDTTVAMVQMFNDLLTHREDAA